MEDPFGQKISVGDIVCDVELLREEEDVLGVYKFWYAVVTKIDANAGLLQYTRPDKVTKDMQTVSESEIASSDYFLFKVTFDNPAPQIDKINEYFGC